MAELLGSTVHYHCPWKDEPSEYEVLDSDYAVIVADAPECDQPGCVYDIAENWQTAESMVLEGYIGIAVDPANQPSLDHQRALYVDCWGAAVA